MTIQPKTFRYELSSSGVATITLTRPDTLNSLTFEVYEELRQTFAALDEESAVRAVLLTGEGRAFCSGGDVNAIIAELFARDMKGLLAFTRVTGALIRNIRACRKPIVAAVNGTAVGAGAVMALACDFRVASTAAKFGFIFPRVGLCGADMGAAYLLPRVVGLSRATELLYLGDAIDAPSAERYGLFNRVVPAAQVLEVALALATRLAEGPTFALGMTKELLDAELSMDLDGALDTEARAQAMCMQTHDFREAYDAFSNKRPPQFKGS